MRTSFPRYLLGLSALLLIGFVACGESNGPTSPSGSSGASGRGTLVVRLTDLPYGAGALHVTFSEVSAHLSGEGGGWQTLMPLGEIRTCDLSQLENGNAADLVGKDLPAGAYTQLRLTVVEAMLYFGGTPDNVPCGGTLNAPLGGLPASVEIPSGEIKLNRPFTLANEGMTSILLDFDGDRSVKEMGKIDDPAHPEDGRYRMTPVIGVVSVDEQGG